MRLIITVPEWSDRGVPHRCGDEVEVDDARGEKLVYHGIGRPAPKRAPVIETTDAAPAPENTAKTTSRPKARKSSRPAKES